MKRPKRRSFNSQLKQKTMPDTLAMTVYGRLVFKHRVVAYCNLHKCYLQPCDIKDKKCNKKKCKHLKELKK